MQDLEQRLDAIFAAVERLSKSEGKPLPMVLTYTQAAEQLSISPRKLGYMISKGQIATCEVGETKGIPRSELERIATPKPLPGVRRSGGRPKATKFDPKAEAEKARALLRASQKRR